MCQCIAENIRAFVRGAVEAFGLRGPAYQFASCAGRTGDEVGLLQDCFSGADYVSCQLDESAPFGRLPFPDGAARTLLWLGTVGHAFSTPQIVWELRRILAPGGALLIGMPGQAAGGPPAANAQIAVHHVHAMLAPLDLTLFGWQGVGSQPHVIYGLGFNRPINPVLLRNATRFLQRFPQRLRTGGCKVGWWQHLKSFFGGKQAFDAVADRPTEPHKRQASDLGGRSPGHWFSRGRSSARATPVSDSTKLGKVASKPARPKIDAELRCADCPVQFLLYMAANRSADHDLLKAWLPEAPTDHRPD